MDLSEGFVIFSGVCCALGVRSQICWLELTVFSTNESLLE
jgi:hypothetical protein